MNLKSNKQVSIKLFLPDSLLSNTSTLLLKTVKIGNLTRIFNLFRIKEVFFYGNESKNNNKQILADILSYLNIAPYLRKYIPKSSSLKFAAILPPIQSPNHMGFRYNGCNYKEGFVLKKKMNLKSSKYDVLIDIGEKSPLQLTVPAEILSKDEQNKIVIVELKEKRILNQNCIDFFWKFNFKFLKTKLSDYLDERKKNGDFVLAASRYGSNMSEKKIYSDLKLNLFDSEDIFLLFGPLKGSFVEYLENQKFKMDLINTWINFIPNQGTNTVKLEEAVLSSLAILNTL